ncbi:MAG: hypothetical protein KDD22_04420, partial [Bdellovibrionales bacterium]|nr:hypothetical protein [Bdellovibrionales bacterium]
MIRILLTIIIALSFSACKSRPGSGGIKIIESGPSSSGSGSGRPGGSSIDRNSSGDIPVDTEGGVDVGNIRTSEVPSTAAKIS